LVRLFLRHRLETSSDDEVTLVRAWQMMPGMSNAVELLQVEARSCARCNGERLLFADGTNCAYPLFQKDPPWPARVVIVAEAPNFDDSFDPAKRRLTVEPGTDPSGAFMFDLLASVGLRPEDVLFTNSVLCLPARSAEGKHYVTARQQDLCGDWLSRFIDVASPVAVVTLGGVALQAVDRLERHGLSLRENAGKLRPWRGRHLLPLYHPGRLGRIARPEAKQREDIAVLRTVLEAVPVLDAATAKAVMRDHPHGARLVLWTDTGEVYGDIACSIGLQWSRAPVFAYLPAGERRPFGTDTRFFVESLSRRGGIWVIGCRHERGIRKVEVHPLTPDESSAVQEWLGSLPSDVADALEGTMRDMLDPRAL
jgi:uracil-DNA glycosylase family 4